MPPILAWSMTSVRRLHVAGAAGCGGSRRRPGRHRPQDGRDLAGVTVGGVFAAAVNGHHGGLPAGADLKNELGAADTDVQAGWAAAIEEAAAFVPEVTPAAPPSLPAWLDGKDSGDPLVTDLLIRLVFSALVDADFLDTKAHFRRAARPAGYRRPGRPVRPAARRLPGRRCPVPADGLRQEVYSQAVAAAAGPAGMYRLPAPTGSGKTLAAGGFALHHARAHQLRQVVVAVPFISITEQNADIYRRLLDRSEEPPVVLEHHSGVDPTTGPETGRPAGGAGSPRRTGTRRSW